MQIGEVSRRTGVASKTIRYYEEIGVLDTPQRNASGYRNYEGEVVDRLRFIKAAQAVGLTLGEIREVVSLRDRGETPCEHVSELITRRSAEIDAQIADLRRLRSELRRLARRSRQLDPKKCRPRDVCHIINPTPRGS